MTRSFRAARSSVTAGVARCFCQSRAVRAKRHHRSREGRVRGGAARRHRRGGQRRPHREGQDRGHRRPGRLSHHRSAARDLRRHLHAAGLPDVRRDGIVLAAEFTATVNAELQVGELAEAVTVTGEAPIVDITTAVHTQVLDREAIDVLPSGRMIQSIGQLVPGVNLNLPDVGGARAMQQTYMSTHGMTAANNTVMVDGMTINGLQLDGAVQAYINEAMSQEMSYQTSGISAETSAGGVRLNMIPREGGNRFSGDFRYSMRPGDWQSSNLTERHIDAGLAGRQRHRPHLRRDVLAGRADHEGQALVLRHRPATTPVNNFIANTFFDDGSQGVDDQFIKQGLVRLTWQVTPRNKLSAYFDEIDKYRGHDMQSNDDPEDGGAAVVLAGLSHGADQVDVDGQQPHAARGGLVEQPRVLHEQLSGTASASRAFTAEWFASASRLENRSRAGRKTAATAENTQSPERQNLQASVSYVTGSHNFKFGVQYQWGDFLHTRRRQCRSHAAVSQHRRHRPTYSVPDSVIVRNTPLVVRRAPESRLRHLRAGLVAIQAPHVQRRHSVGERQGAGARGESPAGRWAPARQLRGDRERAQLEGLGAAVRDGVRPVRQRQDGAQVLAQPLQPVAHDRHRGRLQPAGVADVGRRCRGATSTATTSRRAPNVQRRRHGHQLRVPDAGLRDRPQRACRRTSASAALNRYGDYPRTWNLESALELQHELMPRLSGHGQLVPRQLPQSDDDDQPRAGRSRTTRRTRSTTR